ncbi:polysaccharide deacetylase [Silicimonas algicola]|uniref:Chitooligosaccharide deacetylase n=2 Tax=Silicimonas algicola TaxID=1826607 RepID=A0A316GT25_9RHOB|nr:polysaccharide deacetylase [Silicimonas algicola]
MPIPITQRGQANRTSGRLDILTYHAITPNKAPLGDWCFLPLCKFATQMRTLRRMGIRVLPLVDAVSSLLDGSLQGHCVSITFDDGYLNNVSLALPVLEQYGYHATIYLVTGLVGEKRTLWSNRVIHAVQSSHRESVDFRGHRYSLGSHEDRRTASRGLQRAIKEIAGADPNSASKEIEIACETPTEPEFDRQHDFAMVDEAAIRVAHRSRLIEFGAHTVTHPILLRLGDADLRREILDSVEQTGHLTGRECRTFAYPNGGPEDFDERAIDLLSGTSVKNAVTTVQARNRAGTSPYRLTRWDIGSDVTLLRFVATVLGVYPAGREKALLSEVWYG